MPLEPKTHENAIVCMSLFTKGVQNVHHLHGHMPAGDVFSTGQLQCHCTVIRQLLRYLIAIQLCFYVWLRMTTFNKLT